MANTKSRSLGPGLTTAEQVAGFCYLPFYVFLLAWAIQYASEVFGLNLSVLQINMTYFVLNFLLVWTIFHRFLARSFHAIRFWELVQSLILGFCLYYAGNLIVGWAMTLLKLEVTNLNNETVQALAGQSWWLMLIGTVVVAPLVEETLVRGLIFGSIHGRSRWAAYGVTIVLFAAMHVWQYVLQYDGKALLLASVQYVPAGIALGWTYEKADTIWAPILLHASINAISMGLMKFLM